MIANLSGFVGHAADGHNYLPVPSIAALITDRWLNFILWLSGASDSSRDVNQLARRRTEFFLTSRILNRYIDNSLSVRVVFSVLPENAVKFIAQSRRAAFAPRSIFTAGQRFQACDLGFQMGFGHQLSPSPDFSFACRV
jgi:hypothetical protein